MFFNKIMSLTSLCTKNAVVKNVNRAVLLRNLPALEKMQCRGCMNENKLEKDNKFELVYKLNEIRLISSMTGLRKIQYLATGVSIPIAAALGYMDLISLEIGCAVALTTITFSAIITFVGKFLSNTIGMLYVSEDLKTIKISKVNEWGERIDLTIPTADWVHLSENPGGLLAKYYMNTRRYSTDEVLKLFHSKGVIVNEKLMTKIIGEFI